LGKRVNSMSRTPVVVAAGMDKRKAILFTLYHFRGVLTSSYGFNSSFDLRQRFRPDRSDASENRQFPTALAKAVWKR